MTASRATLALLLAAAFSAPLGGQPVNKDAKTIQEFTERVGKYVAMHRKLEETLPTLPTEAGPERLVHHHDALAKLIAQARAGARPGELFNDDTRKLFRKLIKTAVRGPEGRELVAEILDEYTVPVHLRVNTPYPTDVPLSTVPPKLIAALPRLPEEVEYRFVGRQLILLDLHAQIIMDFMTNALP